MHIPANTPVTPFTPTSVATAESPGPNGGQDHQIAAQLARIESQLVELRQSVAEVRGLVGPFGVLLDKDQLLVQTIYGNKYLIDPHDLIMTPQLVIYRQWEADLSHFFLSRLQPSTVFVDIGANFGYFTCLAGSRIGTDATGKVFAIEPNPRLVRLLRANTLINWSMCPIDIHPVALGEKEQTVELCIPEDRAANGSLTKTDGANLRFEVPMKRLDDLIPQGLRVDLIKLDVEGHEYGVLAGARRVIAESPSIEIVMEWSSRQMADAGVSIQAMLQLLDSLDLRVVKISSSSSDERRQEYPVANLGDDSYDNVLLVRR